VEESYCITKLFISIILYYTTPCDYISADENTINKTDTQ